MAVPPTVVVTGATGFIGSPLVESLVGSGCYVIAVSRQKLPAATSSGVRWIIVDDYAQIDIPAGATLVHLGESSDAAEYSVDTALIDRQINVLRTLLSAKSERTIYISSAAVFGDKSPFPHAPDEDPHPLSDYGRAKRLSEIDVLKADGVVVRPANLFGPRMSQKNVVSEILRQVDCDGPVNLQSLSPVRDYLWIADFVEGIVRVVRSNVRGCFNFGTGIGTSVEKLAKLILAQKSQSGREIRSFNETAIPSTLLLESSKSRRDLGWTPRTDLASGIVKLVAES